ncbi:sortase [Thermoflexus sp.]|uniref:sortase n=1 Tax=Thermoflexus sp. TaxID=1969742 RepID=UPI002ADE051C|nr:sortase [Thermoflexus sp.]
MPGIRIQMNQNHINLFPLPPAFRSYSGFLFWLGLLGAILGIWSVPQKTPFPAPPEAALLSQGDEGSFFQRMEQPERAPALEPETVPDPLTPVPTPVRGWIPQRIVIPAIHLDAPVVPVGFQELRVGNQRVRAWETPNFFAAGWHRTSVPLGMPGNTVLNGHHNIYGEVFRDLVRLKPGDRLFVYSEGRVFVYEVQEKHILPERGRPLLERLANARWIQPTKDERLTLITCWPYTSNTHRLIVIARPLPLRDNRWKNME